MGYKIKKVFVWKSNIPDMQGPCPTGYHVPTIKEWNTVLNYYLYARYGRTIDIDTLITYNDWNNGGYDGASLCNYLLLPKAGTLLDSGQHIQSGDWGYYWASTGSAAANFNSGDTLRIWDGNQFSTAHGHRAGYGDSIRPFKDTAVVPDSTWTSLYSDKIYHNSTLGLISISADGNGWITIADKNLGATTVWNSVDVLSESNGGKFYQRGNNYGFPFTGATSTSSTKVNASTYGPGNYYSSSTFIADSTYAYWDSSMNLNLRGGVTGPLKEYQVYTDEKPYEGNELCFTANTANSTVQLTKTGSPTSVTLETTRDGKTWSTYTIGDTITLTNVGDKVYMRNTSTSTTGFSGPLYNDYYKFVMTGSIAASGDINYLLNKNSTTTLSGNYIYCRLFYQCASLTSTPRLPATTLSYGCYQNMFLYCSNLETLPSLPAITLTETCYYQMFSNCSKIKLSTSKTGAYQTAYRIPTTGTGSTASSALGNMFYNTGGTFTGGATINTTYYTSNTVV